MKGYVDLYSASGPEEEYLAGRISDSGGWRANRGPWTTGNSSATKCSSRAASGEARSAR